MRTLFLLVTTNVLLFVGETVPWLIKLSRASSTEKALFGFHSLWTSLGQDSGELVLSTLSAPLLAVPLGFIGASIFLLPAFVWAELRPNGSRFLFAGALAGGMHAASGVLIAPLSGPAVGVSMLLGYLPYAFRLPATVASAAGAVVAGIASGWIYWRLRVAADQPRPLRRGDL